MSRQLLSGPVFSSLESRAFEAIAENVGEHPESVLYLSPRDLPEEPTRDRWREHGPPTSIRIDTLDDLVSDYYERDQYKGRVTHIDRPLLFRLVELGVEGIDEPTNPLHTEDRFPSSGLVQEAESLYTDLEFAGLLSPEAMRRRLESEGVASRAAHVEELAEAIETARVEILSEELPETYRTERMHHVTTASTPLEEVFSSVEAVVLGGFTKFDALELNLLERIVDTWPTIALLSQQVDADTASGVDAGATRALEAYMDLGFSREFHDVSNSPRTEARRRVTRSLYRHPEQAPDVSDVDVSELGITVHSPETVPDEIRYIARDIRARLASGTTADEIGVILTDPVQYTDQVREVFETYELPFSLQTEVPLPETTLGDAVRTICGLAREPRTVDSLLNLLTNPLVAVPHGDGTLDHQELTHVAARTETNRLETTLEHVDDAVAATVESLIRDASALTETPVDSLPGQLEALLERIGVSAALDGERELSSHLQSRELSARDRLDRVLETLAMTAPVVDAESGDSVDRLERALHGVSIPNHGGRPDNRVIVCSLAEAVPRDFEQVYVLGLTSTHFPSDTDRTAFAQPIHESHPDFEQVDVSAEARHHFASLFASDASLHLSVPQRSVTGDPYVEADVVTELGRLLDLSTVGIESPDQEPGCPEDVQWSIGEVLVDTGEDRALGLVERGVEAGTFDTPQQTRMEAGIACATARASDELTPYDGQLTAETVSRVHGATDREPYSSSRLETYAACGFKYYMRRVLGIKAPDSLTREPDAGARGSYIHDVLEHYYQSLQSADGEPVHPGGDFESRQQRLLEIALERLAAAFEEHSSTAFQTEWLTKVLAGLGTPATNEYYGPPETTGDGRPAARGLFYRFLEHEFDEPAKTTARPTWFEARIGSPHDAGTPIQDDPARIETPHGTVPIHGLIDRVETVPGTDPTQVVVRDYKTGSNIPSQDDALLGLRFQLPLYTLMAEDALDSVETVGGAYYQTSPPNSVSSRKGLVTSQEMAVYHETDDPGTPLLRHSYPHFETHEAFRRFVRETTPRRLGELATGITNGRFHPTVLDPSDAGCRYCDYAHVCDVRSHRRREVIEGIDDAGVSAYVPPKARDIEPEDVVGVE